MAHEGRGPDHPVVQALLKEGHRFAFFQAVRLLQQGSSAPVGYQGPVAQERIRFRPTLDLAFAASDVKYVKAEDGRYEMGTTFLSLYGAVSPLPTYFTEQLLEQDDESLQREFLDLFHHRAISLFYRVWEKYRYAVRFADDGSDYFSKRFLSMLGLDALPADHKVSAVRLLGFAGLVTQVPHSAASVRNMLADYFEGIPVEIEPFVGRWLPVPDDQRNRLAVENCRLGRDLTLGGRVFDRSCTFRVQVGPLGIDDFMAFLPSGDRMGELRELVDLMNGDGLDYEVELNLRESEVPGLQLGAPTARLGWSSWLAHDTHAPAGAGLAAARELPPGGESSHARRGLGRRESMDTRVRFFVKGWFHGRG